MVCICSPQNPTGRVINPEVLKGICESIVKENNLRKNQEGGRPLYLFFDQIYSDITKEGLFIHPLTLCPEIKDYLICADGISKSLNATGVRVGWLFGPKDIIGKMTEVLSHIGAWAPKPEQRALDAYIRVDYEDYISHINYVTKSYEFISDKICDKLEELKNKGHNVDYQKPDGGIYISVYLGYVHSFSSTEEYISFLINTCGLGIVPFEYFGSKSNKGWFTLTFIPTDRLTFLIEDSIALLCLIIDTTASFKLRSSDKESDDKFERFILYRGYLLRNAFQRDL